jgi:hypothetical protein
VASASAFLKGSAGLSDDLDIGQLLNRRSFAKANVHQPNRS